MAEYIDRIAFRKHIDDFYPFDKEGQKDPKYDFAKGAFLRLLARFTQADVVERKTGKWIPIKEETGVEAFGFKENTVIAFFCSNCEEDVDVSEGDFNFCPHCGAKMMVEPPKEET